MFNTNPSNNIDYIANAEMLHNADINLLKIEFLSIFPKAKTITETCKRLKLTPQTVSRWAKDDPAFVESINEARRQIHDERLDEVETEIHRRAVDGVSKPVYQGGELVGHIMEYSDTLLQFEAKALDPKKYRDNTTQIDLNVNQIKSIEYRCSGQVIDVIPTEIPMEDKRKAINLLEQGLDNSPNGSTTVPNDTTKDSK